MTSREREIVFYSGIAGLFVLVAIPVSMFTGHPHSYCLGEMFVVMEGTRRVFGRRSKKSARLMANERPPEEQRPTPQISVSRGTEVKD
jgi:ribosomal protein L24E